MTTTSSNTTTAADAAKARVNTGYIYLASPYSHPSSAVRAIRLFAAADVAAKLMLSGRTVYCPVAHGQAACNFSHENFRKAPNRLEAQPHAWWMNQCYPLLTTAAELWLLQIDGWRNSLGMALEVAHARALDIPIKASTDGDVWAPFTPEADALLAPIPTAQAAAA